MNRYIGEKNINPKVYQSFASGILLLTPAFSFFKHWLGALFILAALFGVYAWIKTPSSLSSYRRIDRLVFFLLLLYFFSFIFTAGYLGWQASQWRALGTEIRFLLVIPIAYFVLMSARPEYFFSVGAFIAFAILFVFKVLSWFGWHAGMEYLYIYGPIYVGTVIVFLSVFLLYFFHPRSKLLRAVSYVFVALGGFETYASSRIAFIAFVLLVSGFLFYSVLRATAPFRKYAAAFFILLILSASAVVSVNIKDFGRFDILLNDINRYVQHELALKGKKENIFAIGSASERLEMYKAAWYLIHDPDRSNYFFGLGRYGYTEYVEKLAERGLVNKSITYHGHPHNIFLSALFFKGYVGLSIMVSIFLLLIASFFSGFKKKINAAFAGLSFTIVVVITQMAESAIVLKGNAISLFLLGVIVLMRSFESEDRGI